MKILIFPLDRNPYQELLYRELVKGYQVEIKYYPFHRHKFLIVNLILFPLFLVSERINGYSIFHLHWLYNFTTTSPSKLLRHISKLFFIIYIPLIFLIVKLLRYKLVWTIHNIVPHESQTLSDSFIASFLSRICDQKIVHSTETIKQLKNIGGHTENISVIPIGSFANKYANTIKQHQARKILSINPNNFTFLFLGLIRKYKGVNNLLDSFDTLVKEYPNSQLVIAGECLDSDIELKIKRFSKQFPVSFFPHLQHIDDDKMQTFFNAADIVVYPFNKLTTSSSIFLAFNFSKPIIFPRIGNLTDLPSNLGYSYEISDENGLLHTMELSMTRRKEMKKLGRNGLLYSKSLTWDKIALKTYKLYSLL